MATTSNLQFIKEVAGKKITVIRHFDAPVDQVWQAWTESEILDQWWAPKPWKAETKTLQFREGGYWIYAMVGPENEKQWCRMDFHTISNLKSYTGEDYFCDENGKQSSEMPTMHWKCDFQPDGNGTKVTITINFKSEADLEKIAEMGFEQGFTAALGNLDVLLMETTEKKH